MAGKANTGTAGAQTLAARLRQLRMDAELTQANVAAALDVSGPSISSWERAENPALPPEDRLRLYARVFALEERPSGAGWREVGTRVLSSREETRRREIEEELLDLRAAQVARSRPAGAAPSGLFGNPWRFPERQDITIVCAPIPSEMRERIPYANPREPDYVDLYGYADLDSLVELFGHVRAANPNSDVRFKLANRLVGDDWTTHVVLLGGVDWNQGTRRLLRRLKLPVRQAVREEPFDAGGVSGASGFEVLTPDGSLAHHMPILEDGELREDVAHLVRGPSPFNPRRTVTICNGMYARGTYGAVRALTDARFRETNTQYLDERFPLDSTYSLLFRVAVVDDTVLTPDWTVAGTVLHEWMASE